VYGSENVVIRALNVVIDVVISNLLDLQ